MTDFQTLKEGFERSLVDFISRLTVECDADERLISSLAHAVGKGGKRLRPVLLLMCYELVSGKNSLTDDGVLRLALGIELVHSYSLVHDDMQIMDDDPVRRGQPAVHTLYGEDVALLCGDALLNLAVETMTTGIEKSENWQGLIRAAHYIFHSSGIHGMIGGQALDISATETCTDSFITRMYDGKTCALFRAACVGGAMAGGTDEDTLRIFSNFATAFGMAFQILDDIADLENGVDEDKITFVSRFGVEEGRRAAAEYARDAIVALTALGDRANGLREISYSILHIC